MTPREAAIAELMAAGSQRLEIGVRLGLSERETLHRIVVMYRKLDARNPNDIREWVERHRP